MAYPTTLSSLTTREAILDALYRCTLGLDTADLELFESAFTPDGVFDLNGTVMKGVPEIKEKCYDLISKLETTHFLTSPRVEYKEGESTAHVTCTAQAAHFRPGDGMKEGADHLTSGSIYHVDVIKDGELWRITHWKLQLIWTQGSWAVMQG